MFRFLRAMVLAAMVAVPTLTLTGGEAAWAADTQDAAAKKKPKAKPKRQRWPTKRKAIEHELPPRRDAQLQEGERLAFRVRMFGADAGEVVLAVGQRSEVNGRTVLPLAGFVRGSDFLNKFYPVDDKIVVLVDEKSFLPVKADFYARENGKVLDYHTTFDHRTKLVSQVRKAKGELLERNFTPDRPLYETINAAYGARLLDLKPGLKFQFYAWTNTKERLISVHVTRIEKVWTEATGWRQAFRLEMSGLVTGGFVKSASLADEVAKKGIMWITADDERIPLKVVMPTKLGEAEGVLVRRYVEKLDPAALGAAQ